MIIDDLENLVSAGEGEQLEFKETTGQRGDACRTLCAFLNGDGGTVVFGVTKKGKLVGQLVSDETKRDLFEAFQAFEPAVDVEVEWVAVDATHTAIVCRVERGNGRPYVYDGRPYKRVQSSTTVMTREEYNRMLKECRGFVSPWETLPNARLTLEDVDLEEVRRTARKAVEMGRLDSSVDTHDAVDLLDRFNLREKGVLLNGAAVLFAKGEPALYPHLQIKMGWFKGKSDREFLDNRHVVGNVFRLMDEAMAFCFKHLNVAAKISGKIERDEELEIPAAALREALVNAFAHREYEDGCRTVYLAIYEDRLEIKSPGGFPPSHDLACLYNPPIRDSQPRNPRIARVLYLCKMIETWGRGLGVIAGECARVGLPLPETKMEGGSVVTTFRRPKIGGSGSDLDHVDPDVIQIDPDSDPDSDNKIVRDVLRTVRLNPLISRKLLAVELGVSERKVRNALKTLNEQGVIVRQGADHGGIWRISHRIKNVGQSVLSAGSVESSVESSAKGSVETPLPMLNASTMRVFEEFRADQGLTYAALMTKTGLSNRTISKAIAKLVKRGLLRRVGPRKGGHWEVI